jgi:hypothetical protein
MGQDDLANRLEATVAEVTAALRQATPVRDWLDELEAGGDALKTDEAAFIANVHVDTIRKRAEAAATTKAVGVLMAGAVWLFSRRRLLDSIEARDGHTDTACQCKSRSQPLAKSA